MVLIRAMIRERIIVMVVKVVFCSILSFCCWTESGIIVISVVEISIVKGKGMWKEM